MAEALATVLEYMRWHGIWKSPNSATYGLEDFMYGLLGLLLIGVTSFLSFMQLYLSIIEDHLDQLQPDDVILGVEMIFIFYSYIMFVTEINKIIPFVEDLRNYKFGKPYGLEELVTKQSKYSKIIYIYTFIGTCIYAILSFIEMMDCEKAKGVNQFCYCIFPIWLPSNFHNIPYVNYFIVIIETIAALLVMLPLISGNYFSAAINEHITIRVKHLRLLLRKLSNIYSEEEKIAYFIYCIEYHVDIIRLTNRLSKTFGKMNNIHSLSPIIIGGLNFKLFMILSLKDSIHVLGWIFSMGILCYNGQALINECQALAMDIYGLKWYSWSTRFRYYIGMVILRTQIPLRITAGIFYTYSNEFLMMIMQVSYTYTTVLMQVFKRHDS